ncbi:hypothetical protein [Yinghuangia soli]|uniref:Secreted protein n=1 Tax=Yinghuangia soli TaxID=2908204 RepID=A0AA41Q3E2_9ACTN|nr:hypothetical protein [Yinghuangia soli]MCF2530809.1 hypothetical protein [Yinghuangia soli]
MPTATTVRRLVTAAAGVLLALHGGATAVPAAASTTYQQHYDLSEQEVVDCSFRNTATTATNASADSGTNVTSRTHGVCRPPTTAGH